MKKNSKKQIVTSPQPKMGEVIRPKHERNDGWENFVTMMGTSNDKRTHSKIKWENHPPEFYEQLYAGGGIPARIVDLIPEESLRRWVDWTGVDVKRKEMIDKRCEQLDVRGAFLRAWKWGRGYGGGVLHIVTDTTDPASPLQPGEKVIGLRDLSRWDLRILTTDIEYDFGSPNFGHPRIYYLNVQMGSQYKGYPIHWTRMIRFDGQLVPRRTYIRNGYWHDSVLNRIYNSIRNYETSNDNAASALQDFNVDIYKLKNVAAMIGAGKESILRSRIEMMAFTKSVINAMILDADTEEYENKGRSLEGVAELLVHQANRLVAETDIPHTKLLGESPDGSNATGNSTTSQWYNYIGSEQENYAKPKMLRLKEILFPDMPELGFKFRNLHVLTDTETVELRYKQAQTDQIYIEEGVLDPSEVTQSRFGGDEYSMETEIDEEAREAGLIGPGSDNDIDDGGDDEGNDDEGNQDDNSKGSDKTAPKDNDNGDKSDKGGNEPTKKPAKKEVKEKKTDALSTTGDQPPEGWSTKNEPKASDKTELRNKKSAAKNADITGRGKADAEGQEVSATSEQAGMGQSEFEPRNAVLEVPGGKAATESFISQTMSEPMRDPLTDPKIKGPGIPNQARTILPTRGNGITASSGSIHSDKGKKGSAREVTQVESKKVEDSEKLTGMERKLARLKERHSDTVSSTAGGSESAVTTGPKRAATIIVRKGDKFLMGKRRDNGRWTLPGGHVEKHESYHQGAVRELMEETGLQATKLKFLGGRIVEPKQGVNVHLNVYEHHADDDAKPTWKIDPDKEIMEFKWFKSTEPLPADIIGNLQHPNNVALDHMGLL